MLISIKTIRSGKLAELMGVTSQTIRKYAIQNKIPYHTTPNGQLFFTEQDVKEILGEPVVEKETTKVTAHYARSSSGDKQSIDNQFEKLEQYYGTPNYKISDKASGLNENRKGIKKLIQLAQEKEITDIYMVRKDRLTRFGYTYLEALFNQNNVTLHYMTQQNNQTVEQELMDDFMAILASFTGKYSQLRSKEAKKKLLHRALENV